MSLQVSSFQCLFLPHMCYTFFQETVSLWERTTCSASTTQNKPGLKGRKHHLLRPRWNQWIGPLLRESFWRSRASTWSRRWRKGTQFTLFFYLVWFMDCIACLLCCVMYFTIYFTLLRRLTEMEILYKKEKEEADQLLEQQRLVSSNQLAFNQTHFECFL